MSCHDTTYSVNFTLPSMGIISACQDDDPRRMNVHQSYTAKMAGARIRAWRSMKGWTQADLAAEIEIQREYISVWERGKAYPSQAHAALLMDRFGIDFNFIYGGRTVTVPTLLASEL